MRLVRLCTGLLLLTTLPTLTAAQTRGSGFGARVVSTRAELVTGGDVLVEVTTPATPSGPVRITLDGRDVTSAFRPAARPQTLLGLVTSLPDGRSRLEIGVAGAKPAVMLPVVNHPITGPVVSGPHQTPFFCETMALGLGQPLDAQCSVATRVEYFYRSNAPVTAPSTGRAGQREVDNPNAPPPNAFKPFDRPRRARPT